MAYLDVTRFLEGRLEVLTPHQRMDALEDLLEFLVAKTRDQRTKLMHPFEFKKGDVIVGAQSGVRLTVTKVYQSPRRGGSHAKKA